MSEHVFRETQAGALEPVFDFEGLYQSDADPWGQSGQNGELAAYYLASRTALAAALCRYLPSAGRRLEIGCGHGWSVASLAADVGGDWCGLDISATAVQRARELHPEHSFFVGDIAGELPFPPNYLARFDAVVFCQVLWYVLPNLNRAVENAIRLAAPGGLLAVSQAFLQREQRYGRHIVRGFRGTVEQFLRRFRGLDLLEARYDDSGSFPHNDGLIVFRKACHA